MTRFDEGPSLAKKFASFFLLYVGACVVSIFGSEIGSQSNSLLAAFAVGVAGGLILAYPAQLLGFWSELEEESASERYDGQSAWRRPVEIAATVITPMIVLALGYDIWIRNDISTAPMFGLVIVVYAFGAFVELRKKISIKERLNS